MILRFKAPARGEVEASVFDHPVFEGVQPWRAWLTGKSWPSLDALNAELGVGDVQRAGGGGNPDAFFSSLRFVSQDAVALADGMHYEQRIAERGQIATRDSNWHDLFNALIWLRYPKVKRAMNARQVADIARIGTRRRTRAQDALTQFDEAGVVLTVRADHCTESLTEAWNRHDWCLLFQLVAGSSWRIDVVGHALLEHALYPDRLLVGKALLAISSGPGVDVCAVDRIAAEVSTGALLNDPQELRPLPLMGLPGWHPRAGEVAFYREGECFQPVRAGRRYPAPLMMAGSESVQPMMRAATR